MTWRTVARTRSRLPHATENQLKDAYREVFGKTSAAVEIVLADLALHTGFYLVEPPSSDLSLFQAGYSAGQRAAFGRLFHYLTLSDQQLAALEDAARQEAENLNQGL